MSAMLRRLKKFVADDSMSIALFGLFALCLFGQGLFGWFAYNKALNMAHFREIPLPAYLTTGEFLDGIFSNWEAAILQLAVLITFGSVFRQKGAPHSRDTPSKNAGKKHRESKRGSKGPKWLFANSLSLVFFGLFAATFVLHAQFGFWRANEEQALRHLPASSFTSYLMSSGFWFSVFQCWEAEFFAIGLYMVLSIFLRQSNSSESKPVAAKNNETGEANK